MKRAPRRRLDGILLLDKPLGWSSNQALQAARRLFAADKAGHTGSLDPLATGMLPICFGEGTKLCGLLLDSDKIYRARMRLGARTSTGDVEGEVVERSDPAALTSADFHGLRARFLGTQEQVPPMYSALKHQGQRLYELARAGQDVERAPRRVQIHALEFGELQQGQIEFRVRCSKGTYVRTLAEDIAAALGQCAHLVELERVSVDPFAGHRVHTLAALEAMTPEARDTCLLPMLSALRDWPTVALDVPSLAAMGRGQAVAVAGELAGAGPRWAVTDAAGRLKAIAERDVAGRLAPRRWLGGTVLLEGGPTRG